MPKREHMPRCPRCGYDQSGEVARWAESCPIEGVCPECGLAFRWLDVLDPNRPLPPWSVEASRGLGTLLAAFRAALQSLAPWRFWRRLAMHHDVHAWRLGCVIACLILIVYPVRVAAYIAEWCGLSYRQGFGVFGVQDLLTSYSYPPGMFSQGLYWPFDDGRTVFRGAGHALFLPVITLAMACVVYGAHSNFFRAPVRREHLVRIALYSLLLPAVVFLVSDGMISGVESIRDALGGSGGFGQSVVFSILEIRMSLWPSVVVLIWWSAFWYAALRWYLRSPRALLLTILAIALSAVVVVGVGYAAESLMLRLNPPDPTFP